MISVFKVRNFRCLREVEVKLTRLHAFIGPNDSGKSTILSAIQMAADVALHGANPPGGVYFVLEGPSGIYCFDRQHIWRPGAASVQGSYSSLVNSNAGPMVRLIAMQFDGMLKVSFDPAALRKESQLIPQGKQVRFFDERGAGLPGIYQAILGRGDDAFGNIRDAVRKLFPTVKLLRVTPRTENTLTLETELQDGTQVPPQFMSDGLLYYLAFAAIPFVTTVQVLVVEEPENGLHPARIRDVVGMLRKFSEESGTQVLMATHSPLVINELKPEEVTVVTRDPEKGTQVTPIENTPNFERRAKTAALGELWLSYADGVQEAPLLDGRSAAS